MSDYIKKRSISLSSNVEKELEELKLRYAARTTSEILSLCIKVLLWISQQEKDGFIVKAEKETDNQVIIRNLPLKRHS